ANDCNLRHLLDTPSRSGNFKPIAPWKQVKYPGNGPGTGRTREFHRRGQSNLTVRTAFPYNIGPYVRNIFMTAAYSFISTRPIGDTDCRHVVAGRGLLLNLAVQVRGKPRCSIPAPALISLYTGHSFP
ncbi:MAG TPA: hypothetical protein VFG95_09910, partial [Nitrospiria bacterium]|nr:hypothetical protein [Nitrospiria bacterium]